MTPKGVCLDSLDQKAFVEWVREIDSLRFDFHLFANDVVARLKLRQQGVAKSMGLSPSIFNAKLSGGSGWSLDQIIAFLEHEDCWDDFRDWNRDRKRLYGGLPIPRDRR
tara:strand:+ start:47 stop:373 length:327 start_codon:yes stop_codon:yes gene_type:complete